MRLKHFLFVHGGPGFNSFPEKSLLAPAFSESNAMIEFWNEPSRLRPQGEPFTEKNAFLNWYGSIARKLELYRNQRKKIHLIGHSYSANGIIRILDDYSDVVSELTLISSALNIYDTYKNVALTGRRLYLESNPGKAREIERELASSRTFFDTPLVNAVMLAAAHPLLFDHYWRNQSQMVRAREAVAGSEAQLDLQSFMSVNADLSSRLHEPKMLSFEGPVRVIFGENDPVIRVGQEIPFLEKTFKNLTAHHFKESHHYPHLEETDFFMRLVSGNV